MIRQIEVHTRIGDWDAYHSYPKFVDPKDDTHSVSLGKGKFKMIPSGEVVDLIERNKRLPPISNFQKPSKRKW